MGAGALLQLIAIGVQNTLLIGDPQVTFFKVAIRRHTNFAVESIENTLLGDARLGGHPVVTPRATATSAPLLHAGDGAGVL